MKAVAFTPETLVDELKLRWGYDWNIDVLKEVAGLWAQDRRELNYYRWAHVNCRAFTRADEDKGR